MIGFRSAQSLVLLMLLASCGAAYGQYLDQEVSVRGLPSLMAVSQDPQMILLTSLDTILHDRDVCCGTNSALHDTITSAEPTSLKELASNLEGRHLLSDGRAIQVKTKYIAGKEIGGGNMIQMLHDQHAALMQWNSHLYVVHSALYFWQSVKQGDYGTFGSYAQLHKLLLWDTRYSDARRQVTFTIGTDDSSAIESFLFVEASRP